MVTLQILDHPVPINAVFETHWDQNIPTLTSLQMSEHTCKQFHKIHIIIETLGLALVFTRIIRESNEY